jgi:GAF domain-containing protein
VIGTLNAMHHRPQAFTDADVEVLTDVARPLASAVEQTRLHGEIVQRAEELAALNRTSQLITARLELGSVLETISRSVTSLMGSTGCGIGLLNAEGTAIDHVAAHGFKTSEWAALSMPVGQGIIGRAVASGRAIRSDDLQRDARSAQREVDEREGSRSMLTVPLRVAGEIIGAISAFSVAPGFFTARHQTLLESFADQAGIAIQNARLYEESQRRARETQALYEAGRAVNQSLEVSETIRLILNQAREVLGVQSCGLFTLDPESGELVSVASLDLEPARGRIRIGVGEGITGEPGPSQRSAGPLPAALRRRWVSVDVGRAARGRRRGHRRSHGAAPRRAPLLARRGVPGRRLRRSGRHGLGARATLQLGSDLFRAARGHGQRSHP